MQLLVHVTYFDANATAGVSKKTSALKTSANWRDFNFAALTRFLEEMEETYVAFSRVDVVVDVNEGNSYQERVRQWRSSHSTAARVHVRVAAHLLSHPFRLAWVHREHMASAIEQYDWFMSAEADTLVPGQAMACQVALASKLYKQHGLLLGFTRVVNDSLGHSFFSDITKPVARSTVMPLEDLGEFVAPSNTYSAVWAYPRSVMRGFVRSEDWQPTMRSTRGMRERAAWGWRHGKIVTLARGGTLRIYHLGKSGPFLVRERGHNSWPVDKLVAD